MKRLMKTVILLVVLVALFGSYFLIQQMNAGQQVVEEAGTYALTERSADDLAGISWTQEGEDFHFTLADGAWSNANDATFPVDQDELQDLADDLLALEGASKLENVKDPADYGLAEPAFTVTAEWTDGTSTVYSMGDATPLSDGYYVMLSGDDKTAYIVSKSISGMFDAELLDLAQQEEIPNVTDATRLVIGNSFDVTWQETSDTINPGQHWYNTATGEPVSDSSVESLISAANAVSWSGIHSTNASESELDEWKLGDSATKITLYSGDEIAMQLLVGLGNQDNTRYVRLPDSKMVYTVSTSSVRSLVDAKMDSLWISTPVPLACADLQTAVFTVGDKEWNFARTDAEDTADDEVTVQSAVTLNGEEYDAASFETMWSQIETLTASRRLSDVPEAELLLSMTVTNESGMEASYEILTYDAENYMIKLPDGISAVIPADTIDKIIRTLRAA